MIDGTTKHIAEINKMLASEESHNPYLVQRRLQQRGTVASKDQPFTYQRATIHCNELAIDLQLGKVHGIADSTRKFLNSNESDRVSAETVTAGVFNAASHAHNQPTKLALKSMISLLEERPLDIGLVLVIVQLYILLDNTTAAVDSLESLLTRLEASSIPTNTAARFSPGLIATLVTLYARQGRTSSTKAELTKAATYYRSHPTRAELTPALLTAIGITLLDQATPSDIELARALFSTYHTAHPTNAAAIAGLAASASTTISEPSDLYGTLPSISKLTTSVDATALESAGIARLPFPAASSKRRTPLTTTTTKSRLAKKHKTGKLPKDYDEKRQPDPERWLPLRDRSNWRPKGKKKGGGRSQGGGGGGATQGGLGDENGSRPGTPAAVGTVVAGKSRKGRKR